MLSRRTMRGLEASRRFFCSIKITDSLPSGKHAGLVPTLNCMKAWEIRIYKMMYRHLTSIRYNIGNSPKLQEVG